MVDYDKIFFHVVRHTFIMIMLNLLTYFDMQLEHMDAKTTIFYGDLKEQIYMVQLEELSQSEQEHLVCKLKKSLYGVKQ